jgi:hypothetical protein
VVSCRGKSLGYVRQLPLKLTEGWCLAARIHPGDVMDLAKGQDAGEFKIFDRFVGPGTGLRKHDTDL